MLIVLTGPASTGKDTIVFKLLERFPGFKRVITTTTRPKRPNETEGKDYHFVTRDEFEQMINNGDFMEYVDFFGNLYGTTKQAIARLKEENLIWRVETSRAAKVKDALVIYIDISDWKILEGRMKRRGMDDEQIQTRLRKDKEDFQKYGSQFKHIVYNEEGKLNETLEQITKLMTVYSL